MHKKFLINNPRNNRLIIFFMGWSTDWRVVKNIVVPPDYDFLAVWGYDDLKWETLEKEYKEIVIIAWSFGVTVANYLYPLINAKGNVTGLFAVNGSTTPIDPFIGINPSIFHATVENLDERNLKKFRIRIAGGVKKYEESAEFLNSDTDIETLKKELEFFRDHNWENPKKPHWDYVFISENDKIFPLENLMRAWEDTPATILPGEEHFIDFQKIFNLCIKDKAGISKTFAKSLETYDLNADVQKKSADRLVEMIRHSEKTREAILEIGCGSGYLSRKLLATFQEVEMTVIDIGDIKPQLGLKFIKGDAELLLKNFQENTFGTIVSGSTFQWLHSPVKALVECERILKPGGILAFSTFISGNFKELEGLSGNSLLYLSREQWEMIVKKAGLEIINSTVQETTLYFHSVNDLFRHLKSTGVNALTGKNKSVGEMKSIMQNYPKEEKGFPLTYISLLITAKK